VNVAGAAPDSASRVDAELVNDFAAAILAIQTALGANPEGAFASVRARLDQMTTVEVAGGKAETTLPSTDGQAQLVATNLVPQGARVKAVLVKVTQAFSTEHGLTGFHVGGLGILDGWGNTISVALNTSTTGADFRRGDQPVALVPENIVITAVGGEFGLTGSVFIRVLYETYSAE
jgi:hypothetical protein